MRLQQITTSYLYEGLDQSQSRSVALWESAGFKLKEAALTADQIQQIFQNIEQGATAAGGNRTLLGKGKDAAEAVNKAWEDLKTKIQDSGPIKNVDAAYDSAVSKIEAGLGGPDNALNKVVQRYRKFAKEYPVAQGFIYAALIAAAGISGAGLGGAAVLGLLKMTDKLLQGEKFSSAAYQGAKTGALAYGASKLGDLIKGKGGAEAPGDTATGSADAATSAPASANIKGASGIAKEAERIFREKVAAGEITDTNSYTQGMQDAMNQAIKNAGGEVSARTQQSAQQILRLKLDNISAGAGANNISQATSAASSAAQKLSDFASDPNLNPIQQKLAALIDAGKPLNQNQQDFLMKAIEKASLKANMLGDMPDGSANAGMRQFMSLQAMANAAKFENKLVVGKKLSEGQIYMVFNRISEHTVVMEGPMDAIKGAAGKALGYLQTKGKNLTTKVTADKLNSAWKKAGSPMDSEQIRQILQTAGVDDTVINTVYKDLKLPVGRQEPTLDKAAQTTYAEVKSSLEKLNKKDRTRLVAYLQKQLGTA